MAGHEAKTCKQLRALLKGRNIDHRKLRLKAQLVAAVNESDSRKRKADEELEQENAKKARIEYEALLEQAEERGLDSSAMTLEELREAIEIHDIQAQVEKRGLEVAGEYLWELREAIKNDDRRNVLLAQVAERGLEMFSTSLNALQDAIKIDDRRIAAAAKREKRELKVYQHKAYLKSIEEWRDESYRRLFQRDFKAVPGRRGLLDLPPHVRKLVYEYAFEEVSGMSPKLYYDRDYDRFEDYGSRSNLGRNTNLLNALGCLNKTVRHEARTTFWSMASFDLQPRGHYVPTGQKATPRAPYLTAIVERFLRGLGDDGRSAIKSLNCFSRTGCPCCGGLLPMDLTNTGYTTFLGVSKMLVDCSSLTTLRMAVSEYHLFRNDEDALKDLFLRGQPLKSEGLTAFQKTVQALLNLLNYGELTPFLKFAFTEDWHDKLWLMTATILRTTKLQLVHGRVNVNYKVPLARSLWDKDLVLRPGDEGYEEEIASMCKVKKAYEEWLEARSPKDEEADDPDDCLSFSENDDDDKFGLLRYLA